MDGVAECRYENNGAFCWFTNVDNGQINQLIQCLSV